MFAVACWLCREVGVKVRARSLTFCLEHVLTNLWGSCAEHVRNTNSTIRMQKSERRWHQNDCLRHCWKTNTVNKNQPLFAFQSISISQRGNLRNALSVVQPRLSTSECLLIHVRILVSSQYLGCFGRCSICSLCSVDSEKIHFSRVGLACH